MKLRQREFCHNCSQYVTYEFEDVTTRQIIICPVCGHQHFRELDEGTIVNIRMYGGSSFRVAEPSQPMCSITESDVVSDVPLMKTKEFKIIGHTEDGRPIIEKLKEDIGVSTENTATMSERRWGRDPRQT